MAFTSTSNSSYFVSLKLKKVRKHLSEYYMKLRSTCSPNCSSFDEGKDVQFVCTTTVAKIKKTK